MKKDFETTTAEVSAVALTGDRSAAASGKKVYAPKHCTDPVELARRSLLFREGTRKQYEASLTGDMWFFELFHHLDDVAAALAAPNPPAGGAVAYFRTLHGQIDWSDDCCWRGKDGPNDPGDYSPKDGYGVLPLYASPQQPVAEGVREAFEAAKKLLAAFPGEKSDAEKKIDTALAALNKEDGK